MLHPVVRLSPLIATCFSFLGLGIGKGAEFSTSLFPVADTGLYEIAPTNNLGRSTAVPAGAHNGDRRSRYVVRFDPESALPSGALVTAAELRVYVTVAGTPEHDYAVHRLLREWAEGDKEGNNGSPASEGETTWLARFHASTLWAWPGASNSVDYAATPSATAVIGGDGSTNVVGAPGLLADVQFWLDHPEANFGWLIRAVDESVPQTVRRFASRETVTNSPVLTISYRVGPLLHSTTITNGWFSFCFEALSNRAYAVEFANNLPATEWQAASNINPVTVNHEACFSQPLLATNRFFRVLEK